MPTICSKLHSHSQTHKHTSYLLIIKTMKSVGEKAVMVLPREQPITSGAPMVGNNNLYCIFSLEQKPSISNAASICNICNYQSPPHSVSSGSNTLTYSSGYFHFPYGQSPENIFCTSSTSWLNPF